MAYTTLKIIGRWRSPRQFISSAHNCLELGLYVCYTMVTQKYAIKSHLPSLLLCRNHSTMLISVYCKTVKL